MPLQTPNLDDRSFQQLMDEASALVQKNLNASWNDLSPGDPGIVLLEAFAYLTEQMIYRLNRLPEKAYIAFLRLLGVSLYPPTAARTTLQFSHAGETTEATFIPIGTLVTASAVTDLDTAPIFVTAADVTVEPGQTATVEGYHCHWIDGELIGIGTGTPGLTLQVGQPPIVARMGNDLDLAVGVEIDPAEQTAADWVGGANNEKVFRLWTPVDNFANLSGNELYYVVDRQSGLIQFAPAARLAQSSGNGRQLTAEVKRLAAVPPGGREIRAWYPYGGGESGNNIPPGTLDRIVSDGFPNLIVTNLDKTSGGLDAETLDNALIRGPQEVYALERAVTAEDFERLAVNTNPEIARAYAYPKHGLWQYAPPGTVEIVLVPRLASVHPNALSETLLRENQRPEILEKLPQELAQRSPIGTRILAKWAKYKQVKVRVKLVVDGNEDEELVRARVKKRLHRFISPLAQLEGEEDDQAALAAQERILRSGWPFGHALQVADIYRLILANEPRITRISSLELGVTTAPNREVRHLTADFIQPHTWYAASGSRVFRSTNNGEGWELMCAFAPGNEVFFKSDNLQLPWQLMDVGREEAVCHILPCPDQAGFVALATETSDAEGNLRSPLYLSIDSGTTWYNVNGDIDARVHDMAWLMRGNQQVLLLATGKGLFEVEALLFEGVPDYRRESFSHVLKPVLGGKAAYPLYALAVLRGQRGSVRLAVATQQRQGVFLSDGADLTRFSLIGGQGEDIRHLNVQRSRNNLFLWAGVMARADNGRGCLRWQIDSKQMELNEPEGRWISQQWIGGSCYAVAFLNDRVFAVTAWGGVLTLDYNPNQPDAALAWTAIPREDLPLRQYELADRLDDADELDDEPGSHQAAHQASRQTDLHPFLPLTTIATNDRSPERQQDIVMVGGSQGIERSVDGGIQYDHASRQVFKQLKDAVTIPRNWLLVSDDHEITSTRIRGTA